MRSTPHALKTNKQNEAAWYQFEFEPISYVHNRICDTPLAKSTVQCVSKQRKTQIRVVHGHCRLMFTQKKNIAKKIKPKHATPQSAVKRHHEFILQNICTILHQDWQEIFRCPCNLSNLACCGMLANLTKQANSQPPSCHKHSPATFSSPDCSG